MLFRKLQLGLALVLALGLAGSATAIFGERGPVASPALAARPEEAKVDEKAPPGEAGPTQEAPNKEEFSPDAVRAGLAQFIAPIVGKLHEERPWGGLEQDKNTTLKEALAQISKAWGYVPFDIDEKAFNTELKTEGLTNVGATAIVETEALEGGRLKLLAVLKRVLGRVPNKSGATYLIRDGLIEITTNAAVRRQLGLPQDRPVPPLFTYPLLNRRLADALNVVAELTDTNVLLDSRVAEKVKDVRVAARMANVPVDTAVRLLADMGGLGVVRQNNVLYVTTPENVVRLGGEPGRAGTGRRKR